MADDNIVTSIAMEGAPEIVAQFALIEAAASKMFDTLKLMGETNIFGALALGAAGAVAGFSAVSAAMLKMAESAAQSTIEVAHLAEVSGASVETISGLQGAFTALGAGGSDLETVFRRLSVNISNEMASIEDSIRKSATQATSDLIAVQTATINLEFASKEAANSQVADALAVQAARIALAKAQGQNTSFDEQRLNVQQRQLALNEALLKQQKDLEEAPTKQLEAENKLAEARLKQADDQANSITALSKFVDDLSKGLDTAGQKVNVTAQNILKGLTASLIAPDAINALKNINTSFDEITRTVPAAGDALFKLADVFKNLNDETLKMDIAVKTVGRSVTAAFVDAMSQGSAGLKAFIDRQKELGLVVTENDALISKQFLNSLHLLEHDIGEVARQFGLLFAPGFTDFFKSLDEAVVNNRETILAWGASIRDTIMPILNDFIVVISGKGTLQTTWVNDLIQGFIQVGSAIKTAATVIFGVFQDLAKAINSVFGTDISGTALLIGFVLFRSQIIDVIALLTGPLIAAIGRVFAAAAGGGAVVAGGAAAAGGLGALLFGGMVLAAAGAGAALGLIIADMTRVKAGAEDVGNKGKEGFDAWGRAMANLNAEFAKGGMSLDTYQQRINDLVRAFTPLSSAAEQVAADFKALADQAAAAAQATADAAAKAAQATAAAAAAIPKLGETTAEFNKRTGQTGVDLSQPPVPQLGETTAEFNARVKQFDDLTAAAKKSTAQVDDLATAMDKLAQQKLQDLQNAPPPSAAGTESTISLQELIDLNKQLQDSIKSDADTGKQSFDQITGAIDQTTASAGQLQSSFSTAFSNIGSGISNLIQQFGQLLSTSANAAEPAGGPGGPAGGGMSFRINTDQATEALNQVKAAFIELQQQFSQNLTITIDVSGLLAAINNAKQAMLDLNVVDFSGLNASLDNVISRFQQMAQAAQQAAQAAKQAAQAQSSSDSSGSGSGDSGGSFFARGGLFRGRPGRDTNLAWLTDFEYVMRPEAVQKYGVALMQMINSLQFPLGGFGLGGLVMPRMAAIPAFATGGLNSSGGSRSAQRVLNLRIEGKTFGGLSIPENTAQALERFAISSQIASAGRKQSWRR